MGDFTYYDIFAAKGMDYLIAIICVLTLIVFWKWMRKPGESGETSAVWRSSFISIAAVLAALVVVFSIFHMGGISGVASEATYSGLGTPPVYGFDLSAVPDGTFRGESHFGSFACVVDVKVRNHAITQVKIVDDEEGQNSPEGQEIIQTVLDEQSPYVCAVSGATISTRTFLRAVESALLSASSR